MISGHALTETTLIVTLLLGSGSILNLSTAQISIVIFGGLVLILMGLILVKPSYEVLISFSKETDQHECGCPTVIEGVVTSVFNPYFLSMALALGNALVSKGIVMNDPVGILVFAIDY